MEGLIAHVDTNRVPEASVLAVPEPPWTNTWHPVSHGRVIAAFEKGVAENNLRIVSREYSLNASGTRMFGVWGLDDELTDGMKLAMGFRNSIDKSMQIGVCAGIKVFVCDNLALSGDYVRFRKHTSGLDDAELEYIAIASVIKVIDKMESYRNWVNELKVMPVDLLDLANLAPPVIPVTDTFKTIVYDLVFTEKVFPPSKIPSFIQAVLAESLEALNQGYQVNSWYTVFNAVTRMLREESVFNVGKATAKVESMIKRRMT